jgi:multiple sugar transport system permease protein
MMLNIQNPVRVWKKLTPRQRSEAWTFYLWIAPWLIGFLIFLAWPLIQSLYLSFTDFRILNTPRFTGLDNVNRLLNDPIFRKSLRVTTLYVLGAAPLGNVIALFVAMLLAQKLRGVNWWRTIYFMPSVAAGVAIAVMWSFIFNPDFGLFNTILSWFGIKGPGWITSEDWALPAIIIMAWWGGIGGQMVIYLAGLKGIPQVLYESAEIDGAGGWSKFWNITIPMLSPTIFFNIIVGIIGAFQVFDPAYVLTDGGPNNATRTYIFNLYEQAFIFTNMGYASLLAWVLFIIILILTLITFQISRNRVYYETEVN